MTPDWSQLADAVAATLGSMPEEAVLVVAEPPPPGAHRLAVDDYYVQFVQRGDHIRAEAVTDEFLPAEKALGEAGARRLVELGWNPPRDDDDLYGNWWIDLPWPAPAAGYRWLGDLAVATLRDVHGVRSSAGLGYRAWINGVTPRLDLPALGLARIPD